MKKNLLNLNGVQLLNKTSQKDIVGGRKEASISDAHDSFTCYCGFVGGEWESSTFTVNADSIQDALWAAGLVCNGRGATCSG